MAAGSFTQSDAIEACAGLTDGGYTWRLPTAIELYSLMDFTSDNINIDQAAFGDTTVNSYWSSTVDVADSTQGWSVNFSEGGLDIGAASTLYQARCVASVSGVPSGSHYMIVSGTALDLRTGLTWEQAAPVATFFWSDAVTYCGSLALEGGGWRLPSVNELLTLIDFSAPLSGPMIDTVAFPGALPVAYWSSTPIPGDPQFTAWYVGFSIGYSYWDDDSSTALNARCVR